MLRNKDCRVISVHLYWNKNFVCQSYWPGSIETYTVNHFHIWWEIMAVEQFSWGMYWTKKKPTFHQVCLVPLFTTRGVVEPPGNDPIISGTSIRSFRHLEHQNPSIIDWVIDSGIQGIEFRGIKLPMEQYHGHFSVNYKINALFDQTRGFFTVKIKSLWPSPAARAIKF